MNKTAKHIPNKSFSQKMQPQGLNQVVASLCYNAILCCFYFFIKIKYVEICVYHNKSPTMLMAGLNVRTI